MREASKYKQAGSRDENRVRTNRSQAQAGRKGRFCNKEDSV